MLLVLFGVALVFFALGWAFGRDARRRAEPKRCPRCGHRRLHWCRGCGVHFDEDDQAIPPREYERLTATDVFFE